MTAEQKKPSVPPPDPGSRGEIQRDRTGPARPEPGMQPTPPPGVEPGKADVVPPTPREGHRAQMKEVRRPGATQVYWIGGIVVVVVLLILLWAVGG